MVTEPGKSPESAPIADTASGSAPAADTASLEASKKLLARSRLLGRVSAIIFLFAVFSVFDGLQTLVRHEFNSIDLVAGENMLVSGMLPADAKSHSDLIFEIEGQSGISFTPIETYKGFWMGGHMWRAELVAAPDMQPGTATVTIVDIIKPAPTEGDNYDDRDRAILFGGQQNPALVYGITVWASELDRRKADDSLIRRYTGIAPFVSAAVLAILAIALGGANFLSFNKAEAGLSKFGIFVIHGVKDVLPDGRTDAPARSRAAVGYKAAFARSGIGMTRGAAVTLYDRDWQVRAQGSIAEVDRMKGYALFPQDGVRPQYGWIVALDEQ